MRGRGYTMIELAVAAFATMLMVTAMARWTADVAAFTQLTLSGRDDDAASAAHRLLDSDLAAAVPCLPGGLSARVSEISDSRLVLPAVRSGSGHERVEWAIELTSEGYVLWRAASPVSMPDGSAGGRMCWEPHLPAPSEIGVLVWGLDEGSSFAFPELAADLPISCSDEWSSQLCRPRVMRMTLFRDGEEYFRRSLALPAAR